MDLTKGDAMAIVETSTVTSISSECEEGRGLTVGSLRYFMRALDEYKIPNDLSIQFGLQYRTLEVKLTTRSPRLIAGEGGVSCAS